ncbi:MAG TPA: hypothetical protein VHX88_03720 [Solirubrobacteraceae bacterium]|nr:hypothetical protein [Solirubrobacteraceae bacterium]
MTASECTATVPVTGGPTPDTSGLSASDILGLPKDVPTGDTAGWMFTAPAGTTISAFTLDRDLYKRNDNDWDLFVQDQTGPFPGQNCTANPNVDLYQCEVSGTFGEAGLADSLVEVGFVCTNAPCVNGADDHDVRADLDSATVTLSASAPPTAITASVPSGYQRGNVVIDVSASDPVGIAQVAVSGPGGPLASSSQSCNYTLTVPCPQAQSLPVTINTASLPSGPSVPLTITATDTAGNSASATSSIAVDNAAPAAPALAGLPAGWTRTAATTVSAALPSDPVPLATLDWELCAASCSAPASVSIPSGARSVSFPASVTADGADTVKAWAIDATGLAGAIASAPFMVDRSPPGAPLRLAATLAADGTIDASWTNPPGQLAPITLAFAQLCRQGGACGTAISTPDSGRLTGLRPPGRGRYELKVWLQDGAGNANPAGAASSTVTVPAGVASSRTLTLRARALARHRLRVSVSTKPARRSLTVTIRAGRWHRVVHLRLRHGAGSFVVRLPRRARRASVVAAGRRVSVSAR